MWEEKVAEKRPFLLCWEIGIDNKKSTVDKINKLVG